MSSFLQIYKSESLVISTQNNNQLYCKNNTNPLISSQPEPFPRSYAFFQTRKKDDVRSTISNFQLKVLAGKASDVLALHFSLASLLIIQREMNHPPRRDKSISKVFIVDRAKAQATIQHNTRSGMQQRFLRLNTTGAIYRRTRSHAFIQSSRSLVFA